MNLIYKNKKAYLAIDRYAEGDTLAVLLLVEDPESGEIMDDVITVNFAPEVFPSDEHCAFVDVNNMGEDICQWLVDNRIAYKTAVTVESGMCTYPEYRFSELEISKYIYCGGNHDSE